MSRRTILLVSILVLVLMFRNCGCSSSSDRSEKPHWDKYTYLVHKYKPTSSKDCAIHRNTVEMAGGEKGYGGFNIDDEGAFVTFDIGGNYKTLTFTMAHHSECNDEVGIVVVHADGKKVLDEKVRGYEPPRTYSIDVSDVNELKFQVAGGDVNVIVADAILWKKGEEPVNVRPEFRALPEPIELVKELKPYYISNSMSTITEKSDAPIRLNGQVYNYGLRGDMTMALIGTYDGKAYFNLHKQFSKLSFLIGCHDDVKGGAGSGWLTVKADNKIIEEIEIKEGDIAKQVVLDITGCKMLSFHTEQIEGESYAEIAQIMIYPEKKAEEAGEPGTRLAPPNPRLKDLPDACKLISSIPPYQVIGRVDKQIYSGASDYITFSMGGYKFNEGIILYQTASFFDDNLSACATFDLGNEFDYITFTSGYVGKSWNMNDDLLMVFADDELIYSAPMIATYPNQHHTVPINKCRTLRFANRGCGRLDVAAFGIGDIVAYRGKPTKNDLFVHEKPECPDEIDLIELGRPYIHYVSMSSNDKESIIRDGTSKKEYFDLNGERIYKGIVLQTSTHFSLDFGVLGDDNGADAAAAGIIGAGALGASFVATGAAVGGATIGTTVAPLGAFLMLAAGGEAVENSMAAFNTYGEYNSVTFKVGCLPKASVKSDEPEHLMIGADHNVMADIAIYETMEPQEFTVPINGCDQLIFWLANTNGTSAKYLIYDIVVTKEKLPTNIPEAFRYPMPEDEE